MKTKQIEDINNYLKRDGSLAMTGNLDMGGNRIVNGQMGVASNDFVTVAQLQAALNNRPIKDPVDCISTSNIALTGLQTIDGFVTVAGSRVLVAGQTLGQNNGIYIAAAGAWSRATDMDTDAETIPGFIVVIKSGTINADTIWELATDGPIVLGVTPLVFQREDGLRSSTFSKLNKQMAANVTTADGQAATATTLAAAPNKGGYIKADINGIGYGVGDGVKTLPFYFSADAGLTAKTFANLAAGDTLYFNGSKTVPPFQLESTDIIDLHFAELK